MGVRAKWHTATVAVDDTDPFADDTPIEQAVHVPTVGLPIDLHASEQAYHARLSESLRHEARLHTQGASCDIKLHDDTTCFACPLYEGDQGDSPKAKLCRLGREQDTLITLIRVRQHGQQRPRP
jgi:hypothetical protein